MAPRRPSLLVPEDEADKNAHDPKKEHFRALRAKVGGSSCLERGEHLGAILQFSQAIVHDPSNATLYIGRAEAYLNCASASIPNAHDELVRAECDCTKAIHFDENLLKAYELRGTCRLHLQNFRGAKDDFAVCLRLMRKMMLDDDEAIHDMQSQMADAAQRLKNSVGRQSDVIYELPPHHHFHHTHDGATIIRRCCVQ